MPVLKILSVELLLFLGEMLVSVVGGVGVEYGSVGGMVV